MSSIKKTILPEEWEVIRKEAVDPDCCLSRLFDKLRQRRIDNNIELMNRSWFLGFMMNCCGCKDGKIGSKFRIPDSALSKEEVLRRIVEETMTEATKPEVKMEAPVAQTSESMSEVFEKPQTMFFLAWVYKNKVNGFKPLMTAGYKRAVIDEAIAELLSLGIITKKDQRHYAFDWEKIRNDFPELDSMDLTDHPEWMAKKKTEVVKETPKVITIEQKMLNWLTEETHVQNQIVLSEVVNQLRILGEKNGYQKGQELMENWVKEGRITRQYGTDAYNVLSRGLGSLQNAVEKIQPKAPQSYVDKLKQSLGFSTQQPPQPKKQQQLQIQTGSFVLRMNNGKDIEIRNNSSSKVSLTIEDGKVILQIQ